MNATISLTPRQEAAFERGRQLLTHYRVLSPDHAEPNTHEASVAGDMIADILYTMSHVYEYPEGDVRSVAIVALDALREG